MRSALRRAGSIAVVPPTAIGDSLLMMVLVNSLIRNGYRPVVVNWVVDELAEWFPGVEVHRDHTSLGHFDLVIQLRATDAGKSFAPGGTVCELVHLPAFIEPPHMIDKLVAVTQHSFGLSHITRHNGITLPARLRFRHHESRVAIHPTGSHIEKIWPRKKFIALAKKLTQQGL
ncbi:glycosyltransferase family 9 protein [Paraburkholderia xenovorans]|uniref:glycosyltransferase family 9 protein n=1 Tax=Paraburkholderia xenovorans TaxID=36873 RepID=UPI0038BA5D81